MEPLGDNYLSPLEWLVPPHGYVRQILCFPSDHTQHVYSSLKDGLARTILDVPYLVAGVADNPTPRGSVRLSDPSHSVGDLLLLQDLSASISYSQLKAEGFPPSAFTVSGITPRDTLEPLPSPEPVFRAVVTLVDGGFLLCLAIHHQTTDITGCGALLKIWASNCRTKNPASEEIGFDSSWLDRKALSGGQDGVDSAYSTTAPGLIHIKDLLGRNIPVSSANTAPTPSDYETVIFHFGEKRLKELKTAVNAHLGSNGSGWVSTGDILTALLWSIVVVAETGDAGAGGHLDNEAYTIGFPINFREHLSPPLASDFLGAAFAVALSTAERTDLFTLANATSISGAAPAAAKLAATVRRSITDITESPRRIRQALGYVSSQADVTHLKLGPRHDGFTLVSWAGQAAYELDWGSVVGKCDAVRFPSMGKRYPIVLPRVPAIGGDEARAGLEVILSLDRVVMERFKRVPVLDSFATVLCS